MMVRKNKQALLFNAGTLVEYELDPASFFAQLAAHRTQLFRDEDFAALYKQSDRGRPSIPPSQMATLMLLQYYAGVSDGEAVERSGCDLRWAAALGRMPGPPLCDRTTLVVFRGRLVVKNKLDQIFDAAIQHARDLGILKRDPLKILVDTRPIVGRGAVEDTFNLIARAMDRVMDVLARAVSERTEDWAAAHDLARYVRRRDGSLKGGLDLDWHDPRARQQALTVLVADARRLLKLAQAAHPALEPETQKALTADTELLSRILEQDVEERESPNGRPVAEIKEGTARDRVPSATDPDQRHGRKSASQRFNGHKARVALDAESGLILDAEVLAGNAADAEDLLRQTERVEERTETPVEVTIGDCAFGSAATRQAFEEKGRRLHAKQAPPATPEFGISKRAFKVIFEGEEVSGVTCPAGKTVTARKRRKDGTQIFHFGALCRRCPLRHKCVNATLLKTGRTIQVHPQEQLLQAAREFQETEAGKAELRSRVAVEHGLARLARLGIGQARYLGKIKTWLQLLTCAAVANLRLMWNRKGADSATATAHSGLVGAR